MLLRLRDFRSIVLAALGFSTVPGLVVVGGRLLVRSVGTGRGRGVVLAPQRLPDLGEGVADGSLRRVVLDGRRRLGGGGLVLVRQAIASRRRHGRLLGL